MDEMVAWMRACMADEERVARAAAQKDGHWAFHEGTGLVCEVDQHIGDSFSGKIPWSRVLVEPVGGEEGVVEHIARQDPAATLARVEAHRRIVDEHQNENGQCTRCWDPDMHSPYPISAYQDRLQWPCPTIRALALAYAHHPGYREEWRP